MSICSFLDAVGTFDLLAVYLEITQRRTGCRPSTEDNYSRADIQSNSTTSSVILLLYNSFTSADYANKLRFVCIFIHVFVFTNK